MELSTLAQLGSLGILVGLLIGCVGIGGVLLVPILTYIFGMEIHTAIAAAMFSYMFSGSIGTFVYAKKGSVKWPQTTWLIIGAAPAAFIGAKVTLSTPGQYLEVLIAIFVVLAGINALLGQKSIVANSEFSNPYALIFIGVVAGLGSALTGTGGPLIVVPIMVSLKVAAHTAIGFSQVIQLPIAGLATFSNFLYGSVDLVVGGIVAGGVVIGSTWGAKLAHLFSTQIMHRILSLVLIAVGIAMIARVFWL